MEEKIKYVLNGETKYYTKEELKEYYSTLLKNSEIYYEDGFEEDFQELLEILKKYDGDPYGDINDQEDRTYNHRVEASGFLYFIR